MVCGATFADVNRDGLLDLVVGQHFSSPWRKPVPVRLYLNRGVKNGVPRLENVSAKVGLKGLPLKAPHVELQDFDNDGLLDLYVSIIVLSKDRPRPVIFRNQGIKNGMPRFQEHALSFTDFPTEEDRNTRRSGTFFNKMIKEGKIIYMAPGPSADFDNDGKLDLFLPNWWTESRSLLLKNESKSGNWLQIALKCQKGVNRMGIGATFRVYAAGTTQLLCCREMSIGDGYASGQPAITHFGLGKHEKVDVKITLPHGKGKIWKKGLRANQRTTLELSGK